MKNQKNQKQSFDKNKKAKVYSSKKVEDIITMADFQTDPFGSYTGVPYQDEVPTQDADDL